MAVLGQSISSPRLGPFFAELNERDMATGAARLAAFCPEHAVEIASWVRSERDLRWLAPNTAPPLTTDKICAWKKLDGDAFVLLAGEGGRPIGYGELNPMSSGTRHCWLGHVVVRPDQRRRGIGRVLLRSMLAEAFDQLESQRVSLIVFPDNMPAIRCYQGAGFAKTGDEFHRFEHDRSLHRLWRMELQRSSWDRQERPTNTP